MDQHIVLNEIDAHVDVDGEANQGILYIIFKVLSNLRKQPGNFNFTHNILH